MSYTYRIFVSCYEKSSPLVVFAQWIPHKKQNMTKQRQGGKIHIYANLHINAHGVMRIF